MNTLTAHEMYEINGGGIPDGPMVAPPDTVSLRQILEEIARQQEQAYLRWVHAQVAR